MRLKRVMIAAPKSKSGKTMITCALLQALKSTGQKVAAYKCGPDYIDPMFHQKVINIPSKNLDTFFTDEERTKELFLRDRTENDFAILEGVMGLFDGLGGVREEGSSYHLAKVTKTPIILVVDAKGMGRSLVPVIAGFLKYDEERLIKGIILNRMTQGFYEMIKPLIEEQLHVCVAGYFPDHEQFRIESRHLGLVMPDETADMKEMIRSLSAELQKTVSMEKILQIANTADELSCSGVSCAGEKECNEEERPIIAVARDEAFCFYYEDNLNMLQEYGAGLKFFSPVHDTKLPDKSCGLLIGGGYPELYGDALSKNTRMLSEVKRAIENGMPVVAECGGFMYLHSSVTDRDDNTYAMVGAIPSACRYMGRSVRFGYIELEEKRSSFLPEGERIRGHEFHYFDSETNGSDCLAVKPVTGNMYSCVIAGENRWMGFPHLYYPSNPAFARKFVEKVRKYGSRKFG